MIPSRFACLFYELCDPSAGHSSCRELAVRLRPQILPLAVEQVADAAGEREVDLITAGEGFLAIDGGHDAITSAKKARKKETGMLK